MDGCMMDVLQTFALLSFVMNADSNSWGTGHFRFWPHPFACCCYRRRLNFRGPSRTWVSLLFFGPKLTKRDWVRRRDRMAETRSTAQFDGLYFIITMSCVKKCTFQHFFLAKWLLPLIYTPSLPRAKTRKWDLRPVRASGGWLWLQPLQEY